MSTTINAPISLAPITITAPITLGFRGLPGADGIDGEDGADGASAYSVYLATSGDDPLLSEAEWSASRGDILASNISNSTALGRSIITAATASAARTELGCDNAANLTNGDLPRARIDIALSANAAPMVATTMTAIVIVSSAISSTSGDIVVTPAGNQFTLATGKRLAFGTGGGMPMMVESAGTLRIRNVSNNAFFPISCGAITSDASIELTTSSNGLVLKSPDGTRYRITVANGGTLAIAAV